ncbi:arginase [Paenibacillus sediminis]|uniref:Arginase n=1 Tax=Paenibacillus sediminis TaxID=664909 RepID=A0ABS4H0R1_9BACL|nr:arginase [Paenibacillus sediminis]MBP1936051.1 arginase [Paenibacillus sediminis]
MNKKISVVHVPFTLGSHRRGCDLGPKAIKYAGLMESLQRKNYDVSEKEVGLVQVEDAQNPVLKNLSSVIETGNRIAKDVDQVIKSGTFPLIIGGDHSIAIGTIAGVAKNYSNLGVIWVDAHGDLNTEQTTPSGNIHGMPLAINIGIGDERLTSIYHFAPKIKPENVVIIGVRDLDPGEIALLNEKNITCYSNCDVEEHGIARIMDDLQRKFEENGVDYIHLSVDLDVLEPYLVKGVGTPVQGGLTYRETAYLLKEVCKWNKLVSAEFVELNPLLDERNVTAEIVVSLINELF